MSGCLVYAGEGWSAGALHLLRASPYAAHCLTTALLEPSETTRERDHLLAMHVGRWDVLTRGKHPFVDARAARIELEA